MSDTAKQSDTAEQYPPGTEEEQALFEQVLEAMLADFGQHDKATKEQVNTGMRGIWAKPLVAKLQEFASMDSSEEVDVTAARRILFMPRASDAKVYARIFAAPEEGKQGVKMVQHASSIMYMRHSKDELFLEHFVAAGGISALAHMFEHINPYLRSQAADTLKRIIKLTTGSSGEVVWGQSKRSPRVELMFARMFDALCGEHFLPGLVANLEKGETWPGGFGSCLELLAFALSWLQNFFVPDGEDLRLPGTIRQLFDLMEEELPEDHGSVALVIKLKEDFPALPSGDERDRGGVHLAIWRQCRPPAEASPPELEVGSRLQLFRALGNEAFKKQRWSRAELCYSAAEREGGPGLDLVLSNRAATRLKLQNYAGAREDAASAVALDAKNAKAWFRLAEARVGLADAAAREAADMAHSLAPSSATVALVKKAEAIAPAEAIAASPVEFGELD